MDSSKDDMWLEPVTIEGLKAENRDMRECLRLVGLAMEPGVEPREMAQSVHERIAALEAAAVELRGNLTETMSLYGESQDRRAALEAARDKASEELVPLRQFFEDHQHDELGAERVNEQAARIAALEAEIKSTDAAQVERRVDGVCTHVLHVGSNQSCFAYIAGVGKGLDVSSLGAERMSTKDIMDTMRSLMVAEPTPRKEEPEP